MLASTSSTTRFFLSLSNITVDFGVWVTKANVLDACAAIKFVIIYYTVTTIEDVIIIPAKHVVITLATNQVVITIFAIHEVIAIITAKNVVST
jgi:hypothetical protein